MFVGCRAFVSLPQRGSMFVVRATSLRPAPAEPTVCRVLGIRLPAPAGQYVCTESHHTLPAPAEPNVCRMLGICLPAPAGQYVYSESHYALPAPAVPNVPRVLGIRLPAPAGQYVCSESHLSPTGSSGAECL